MQVNEQCYIVNRIKKGMSLAMLKGYVSCDVFGGKEKSHRRIKEVYIPQNKGLSM